MPKPGMYDCRHANGKEFSDFYTKTIEGKLVWVSELSGYEAKVTHWKEMKKQKA